MPRAMARTICIAAALIDDGEGQVFLVRKRGTGVFMQAGGKMESGETAFEALRRELTEELCFATAENDAQFLGTFNAEAANEPGYFLRASLFHVRAHRAFSIAAELEEAIWISIAEAKKLRLAPLTRDHVLPLAAKLCK